MKIKEVFWLCLMVILSIVLGTLYSIYNTDSHHWGFILGTTLDSIHGKHFFTEIYIQYGMGEPILFKLLHSILPIHYTSIGIITSIAYACNLLLLFLALKKFTRGSLAIFITILAFLLHTYSIYPWPDYYAGLCLSLACYEMISHNGKENSMQAALPGFFLFLAFFFRNTYLFSIGSASLFYLLIAVFKKELRNKNIFISIGVFTSLILVFFVYLNYQHGLDLWRDQTISAASSQYGMGLDSVFLLLKHVFLPDRFYLPNNLVATTYSVLFYLSIYLLYRLIFKQKNNGLFVFLALLGLAGMVQATLGYEIFRLQNACLPLFFVLAILVESKFPDFQALLKQRKVQVGLGIYLLLMLVRFPHASTLFPIIDGDLSTFNASDIPIFKGHRFQKEEQDYYHGLHQAICTGGKKIVNRTMDSTIPYLCEDQFPVFSLPFFNAEMLSRINAQQLKEQVEGNFNPDEVIITDSTLSISNKLKLIEIGQVNYPKKLRYFGPAVVHIYHVEAVK